MKWFYNLKISNKLLLSFAVISVMTGIVGYIGISSMSNIDELYSQMYTVNTIPISKFGNIQSAFHRIRVNLRDAIMAKNESVMINKLNRIDMFSEIINKEVEYCSKLLNTDHEKQLFYDFTNTRKSYRADLNKCIEYLKKGDRESAESLMNGNGAVSSKAEQDAIEKWVEYNLDRKSVV